MQICGAIVGAFGLFNYYKVLPFAYHIRTFFIGFYMSWWGTKAKSADEV